MPPIFKLLCASAQIVAIVGDRIGAFGSIPPGEARPYVLWDAGLTPQNVLAGAPPADLWSVQIEINAKDQADVALLVKYVRAALQSCCVIVSGASLGRDPETGLYGFSLTADYYDVSAR